MGDEADLDSFEELADPALVAKLRALQRPPSDPVLLAGLIQAYAGADAMFGLLDAKPDDAQVREQTRNQLRALKTAASAIVAHQATRNPNIDPWMLAVDELITLDLPENVRRRVATKVVDAIDLLASINIAPKSGRGRPRGNERVMQVVRAVATYCDQMPDLDFVGEPRFVAVGGRTSKLASFGAVAELTRAVLDALGASVTDSQITTYMRNVREERGAGKIAETGAI